MQFLCVPTTFVTEIKETYFEIYINQESCNIFASLKHLNLRFNMKNTYHYMENRLNTIYMTAIPYEFNFMNYAFAKLVVAWLQMIWPIFMLRISVDFQSSNRRLEAL